MARPQTYSNDEIADAVAALAVSTLEQVAEKYGVTKSTVSRWRQRAENDDELKALIAGKMGSDATPDANFRALLPIAMTETIRAIQSRVDKLPDDADSLRACTEAFQTLANYQKGFEAADAYIAALADRPRVAPEVGRGDTLAIPPSPPRFVVHAATA
jgi:transposase-like protein